MKICSRNMTCALNSIITILTLSVPDGDLLQKHDVRTKFDNYYLNFECT